MCKALPAKYISQMVDIHAGSFSPAWSAGDFKTHMDMQSDDVLGVVVATELQGFIVTRFAVDQAEILTIVVAAKAKQGGMGTRLLKAAEAQVRGRGADIVFLEVAVDNIAAIHLYKKHGYHQYGKRPGYYRRESDGKIGRVDAVLFQKHLTGKSI